MFMPSLRLLCFAAAALVALPAAALAGNYRGMTAGWPQYANGYYAAYYPAQPAAAPAYYVARPPLAAAPGGGTVAYVPVTAAYRNPTYFAAYGGSPAAPAASAGYGTGAPIAAYYAPTTPAYYAPATTAYYAPSYGSSYGYAVSPAGLSSAGSEAPTAYGQPYPMNYVPPRFTYRMTYAPVPVYVYRPVTAYDPVIAQTSTCQKVAVATTCQPQPQRQSWLSCLHPHNWFSWCRPRGCGTPAAAPTTSYCGAPAIAPTTASCTSGCGQPYYPTVPTTPVIPTVPAPVTTVPSTAPITTTPLPSGSVPPAGPRIVPPPTRSFPGTTVPGTTGTLDPASIPPRLTPGTITTPGTTTTPPSTTFPSTPGTTLPPTTPPGSFPTTTPPSSFGAPSGSFPSGTNYPPATDPYGSSAPSATGTSYDAKSRSSNPAAKSGTATQAESKAIRAPELAPALPPNVEPVPDLDASRPERPVNRAPLLLDPRDKTAAKLRDRWAVVPAIWPSAADRAAATQERELRRTSLVRYDMAPPAAASRPASVSAPATPYYDDSGWKSAR